MSQERADTLVVLQGLAETRSRAQALILAGAVFCGEDRVVHKAGELLNTEVQLHLRHDPLPYVSRGGLKLAAALDAWQISPQGLVCLDVGASTGGFTDCLLQRGAVRVYAVDVGYGQLAWKLRQDARVCVLERANIRTMPQDSISSPVSLIVVDVSFISLHKVLPAALRFAAPSVRLVLLMKPQFEVGRAHVGKGGIVKDAHLWEQVQNDVAALCSTLGFYDIHTMPSPIVGAKGNHEFLLTARRELSQG